MNEGAWEGGGAHILVVDDTAANRTLLRDLLEERGCRVSDAATAADADAIIARDRPDLILMDVSMPGEDGFSACTRLKAAPLTEAIPIILVTALAHREDRIRGMEAGANDYLTKPVDRTELGLRVRNALALHRLHDRAEAQYRQLREMETLRDSLVHMLVHDLRTPLTGIRLYLEMLRDDVIAAGKTEAGALLDEASGITVRMTEMINDLLDTSRFEAGAMPLELKPADAALLTREAVALVGTRGRRREVRVSGDPTAPVTCDPAIIRRVIANLIGNAVDYSPEGETVEVRVARANGDVEVRVQDRGPGIPEAYRERIFEKFGQIDAVSRQVKHSTGLGLTFCRMAVQAHGGRIGVDSPEGGTGSTFWIRLPAARGS